MKSIKKQLFRSRIQSITALIVVLGVIVIGVHLLVSSHAQSPYVTASAASGTLAGGASLQASSNTSSGSYVQFLPAVHVDGTQLVNGQGKAIRLIGFDASDPESQCVGGNTVAASSPLNVSEAEAIASWKANAVRIPLNEDCWLGINNFSINNQSGAAGAQLYQTAIENWVQALNSQGIIAILDLQYVGPGNHLANTLWPMADEDHAPAFWSSVTTTFKSDPAVMYDLFNEPFIGNSNGSTSTSPWTCWLNGCNVTYTTDSTTYVSAGMQQLVTTIRTTGATQPIILGGLDYSGDPCGQNYKYGSTAACPELANMPKDPDNQLIVDYHSYYNPNLCPLGSAATYYTAATEQCLQNNWNGELNPINAAGYPMVTDEFGENDCSDNFMNLYMGWADQNNQSYMAWSFVPPNDPKQACVIGNDNNFSLLSDWKGDPSTLIPQGPNYKAHLAAVSPY